MAVILINMAVMFLGACDFNGSGSTRRVYEEVLLLDSVDLDKPLLRFNYSNNKFYCYNFSTKEIYQMDDKFNEIESLGAWGDGPKENLLVRDYFILNDDKVGIFDVEKNTYKVQDFRDSVYFYHKFSTNLQKGIVVDSNRVLLGSVTDQSRMEFNIFDFSSNEYYPISKINNLFNEENSGLIYEGQVKIKNHKIYFLSYFSSFWFIYDLKDESLVSGSYWFDFETPKVLEIGGGIMLDNASELFYDSFFYKDFIVLISNFGDKKFPNQRILDFYSIENFEYVKSIPLPDLNDAIPEEGFFIGDRKIGVLYEDKIYFFNIS